MTAPFGFAGVSSTPRILSPRETISTTGSAQAGAAELAAAQSANSQWRMTRTPRQPAWPQHPDPPPRDQGVYRGLSPPLRPERPLHLAHLFEPSGADRRIGEIEPI